MEGRLDIVSGQTQVSAGRIYSVRLIVMLECRPENGDGLESGTGDMLLREFAARDLQMVSVDATVQEAAAQMQANCQSTLAVLEGGVCVGILTSKDIIEKAVARGLDPRLCCVEDIMRRDVVCCHEDEELEEAALSMQAHRVSAVVVVDRLGRPAGVISLGEVIVGAVLISTRNNDQETMSTPLN